MTGKSIPGPEKMNQRHWPQSRRSFLHTACCGLGGLALASMLHDDLARANPLSPRRPHRPAKAKAVIHLYMAGGPSHLDTFDPKPELNRIHGQPFPESFTNGQQLAQLQNTKLLARGCNFGFTRCGLSGQMISDLLPYTQQIADDICIVRSMHTEQINHDPAHAFMNAGSV